MKLTLQNLLGLILMLTVNVSFSQGTIWTKSNKSMDGNTLSKHHLNSSQVETFTFNPKSLSQRISLAPVRGESKTLSNTIIDIPSRNGAYEQFRIYDAPNFSSSLAAQYPNIKSYVGFSINDPRTRLNMSVSPQGVQTMISYVDKETVFMMPSSHGATDYILYTKSSRGNYDSEFVCSTIDDIVDASLNKGDSQFQRDANDQTLRSYRLAVSVNGEYTSYHGGTIAGALAGINATLSRVNAVFETDMAITFSLIDAPELIFTNATTDPYSNTLGEWNVQLQNTLTDTIGNDAYDIGHMFGASGGGGNAGCIGCVCEDDTASTSDENKGSGITSPANGVPETDTFDIDFVAHEIGHQMGANHTWSFASEGLGVNVEPGSGTTIMGYAGITNADDVALNSDPYFHYASINQILNNVATAPNNCAETTAISNNPPIADAGANYTIPKGTAYILKGAATDADGTDMLTYCWEQNDTGVVTNTSFGPNSTNGAQARSLPPTTSPDRYIPKLSRVLIGQLTESNPGLSSDWVTVSNVARDLTWALTVRDRDPTATGQNGQSSFDQTSITVNDTADPFVVTSQNDGSSWASGTDETITWDFAGTTTNGINTSNVNILLSIDGGQTFDIMLASNTPNDGSETITVPNSDAVSCRVMVEPIGNIYYAINSEEFPLDFEVTTTCTQYASGALNLAIPDGTGENTPGAAITHTISIPDATIIDDLRINVDVSHMYIGDLVATITRPGVTAFSDVWNRTCNSDNFDDFDVTFKDGEPAIDCATPTIGTYSPAQPLDIFTGADSSGDWTISITDFYTVDIGTLNDWSIEVCTTTVTPLSVDNFAAGELSIFPNPNKGEFIIKLNSSSNKDITVAVFDIRGRQIFNEAFPNESDFNQIVRLDAIQSGIYLVKVGDGEKDTTRKIVVK